jgi:hypothetical protein
VHLSSLLSPPPQFGSRGPSEADALVAKYGYQITKKYKWEEDDAPQDKPAAKL